MRHRASTTGLILVTAASSACGEGPPPATVATADSAGVQIVTNPPGVIEAAEAWSLSDTPVTDIGTDPESDLTLFRVAAVVPLDEGRVAISMTTPPNVLLVRADGTLVATLGRGGDGPGEFSGVGSVLPLGRDSLAVWDPERRRISVFSHDGGLLREVDLRDIATLSWIAAPDVFSSAARTRLLPSSPGSLLLFSVGVFGPGSGVVRPEAPSFRLTTDGDVLANFGSFPGGEIFRSEQFGVAPYPFGADTHGTTSGEFLVVGTADTSEFRMYGPTGALHRIVQWPDQDRAIAGARLASWSNFLDGHLAELSEGEAASRREILEAMPQPDRFPAYGSIVGTDTGEIWVGPYQPGQLVVVTMFMGRLRLPSQRWLVFDSEGAAVATVNTPAGFEVRAVRGGRVWGVYFDELDVESVRAYELLRS